MKLRLKENPREWLKFAALANVFLIVAALLFRRRGILTIPIGAYFLPAAFTILVAALRPRWLRQVYRIAMTASHYVGGLMGTVLLSFFFFLVVTPMGWLLRLCGKDVLNLKRKNSLTYWSPVKNERQLNRMF